MTDVQSIRVKIDGTEYEAPEGSKILDILNQNGIEIPQICHVPEVDPIQTCDTCIVEVNGKLQRSCSTAAENGMSISLTSGRVKEAQTEAMDRLLENHLLYCTVCDNNNGNCTLHNTAEMMGIEHQKYPYTPKDDSKCAVDMSHPFYRYDPNQCIACGQCVEVCQNLQVNETLSIDWERDRPRVIWDEGVAINESSCVSCGQCVTVCPCNALMEKSMLGQAGFMTGIKEDVMEPMIDLVKNVEPDYTSIFAVSEVEAAMRDKRTKKTKTVCTFCGVGCSFEVWTKGRDILKIQPVSDAPVNAISTCVKGKFGWDFVNSEERITKPLIRKNGAFVESSWEEALDLVASRLGSIKAEHGNGSVGFISSSKITNEDNYVIQKLARQVFETNNVDNCSRYCQSPATDGLFRTVGMGGDAGTIKDIAKAGLVLIVGANPAEGHPVLATRVKRAHKLHGQKLIVADLRRNEMAERSDLFISPKQGTDQVWLMAVTKYMIDQGWHDQAFIDENVNYFDDYKETLEKYTLDYAERITGLSQDTIIRIAEMIRDADGTCVLWGMGVTQNTGGSDTSAAISNLLLATGNYRRPGAGAYPLRGHNNVQGACDMGTLPGWLPGYQHITDDAARAKFEKAYGVEIDGKPGLDNIEMLHAIEEGNMKAMYLVGEDMALVDSNANHVHDILSSLDFFVVQDIFLSRTAQYADVILPAVPSLEKDGTFTNTERRVQRLYQALPTLGDAKPDWWIIQEVANRLGADWNYTHPSDIFSEMASLSPLFGKASYDVLSGWNSFLWGSFTGESTPLLYEDGFNFPDKKARFALSDWVEPAVFPEEYDLHINNGRMLEHFHEGNMTNKSKGIQSKVPDVFVEVSPELAAERGICDGTMIRLVSPFGAVKLNALVTDRVRANELYLPMNSTDKDSAINFLTGPAYDSRTHTPAYKQTKVRMEVLGSCDTPPLPKTNPRNKKRHPQNGVEAQRKWNRPGYVHLTD
ncbi:formate dehydrogenase subunit alpha [Bacillus velezensis]|uniref:Formate dehydrogenase subunit alpha n=1 Tax=Bacillus velezensis (strain DSM 23117 / BGSC 10A6 / LMG 26770 / FZB42) TaxID=326423 RepID=A7Z716_BACVZ|nr:MULTISPECIES: formate dehydrogenase subunit alpha [Bacillus amyloliquefaciens group]ABS74792.2 formate dehydrogenase subunit alpha [Bacillus velezensis FZB42]MBT9270927.1 formate dehydrogenase subunit alpha [Bacillus velezensis]MCF7603310.1 formate dehydrogenase subunit alpha [Bacillus velezensis]MDF0745088.1 formate dehydrogenase subunit alpha [Bacillus velezensis]MDJ0478170.1 formate dehydrogenase subunit alpha [Bacillus amyloliquefaciens]